MAHSPVSSMVNATVLFIWLVGMTPSRVFCILNRHFYSAKNWSIPRHFELDAIDHDLLVSFELIHEALDRCDGKHATAHECCSSVDRPFAETERADGHIRLSRLLRIDDEHFEERHGFPGCDYCAAMARKGILSSVNNAFLTGCYPALFKLAQYRHGIIVSSVSQPSVELAQQHGLRAVFFVVDVNTTDLAHLADMFDAQELIASVGAVLPLAEARTAHELLEGKGLRGRGKKALKG